MGHAEEVNVYDYKSLSKGKAVPYGIYEIIKNNGFVNVGISKDTAEFAVNSISRWWTSIGKKNYPKARELLICADCGGSNGNRNKLWKYCLHKFAKKNNLKITVCHYPPGTSKWNKIEHKMFSFISMNWKGKPLISFEVVINLIQGTQTERGLKRLSKKVPEAAFLWKACSIGILQNITCASYCADQLFIKTFVDLFS